jgi:hypothetical protein
MDEPAAFLHQAPQAAEALQQLARQIDGALAAHAGAQKHRDELGVAQCLGTARQQPLARPLGGRPVGNRHAQPPSLRILYRLTAAAIDSMTLQGKRILLGITGASPPTRRPSYCGCSPPLVPMYESP